MKDMIEEYGEVLLTFLAGVGILAGMQQVISVFKMALEVFSETLG